MTVPPGHFLIIMNNTLMEQWEMEIKRFLDMKFWNLMRYPSSEVETPDFWKRFDAMTRLTETDAMQATTIILATYSVCSSLSVLETY